MIKTPEPIVGAAYDSLVMVVSRCGVDMNSFMDDMTLQDATRLRIEDAGDHLARIRDDFQGYYSAHASTSWNKLIGLSQIIGKSYELDKVWLIIQEELPILIDELAELLH